ncbi:palmitoyl-acyl carrier protein thioesterase chloroplastic [Phtheirospermum japonicum]|uniref:Acyl-[acyl-carrier-protein] hydrolase n=1 Tax=Phtheirospermum japonicum TaxID=374723 RepID=A0A830BKR3_9LAMI|nr:palmitoyl-acyl carrier protein thioesterase chloroplastic [Phtheirospermum japonicum]
MAAMCNQMSFFIQCSSNKSSQEPNKQKHHSVKIKGTKSSNMEILSQDHDITFHSVNPAAENLHFLNEHIRQNIPKNKQSFDPYRLGMFINEGLEYRQSVVIRSHEVGPDKTMTLESILNLLQETALNHVWLSGLMRQYGTTLGMIQNNLIWVVSKMQVQIDHYPIWGEVIEIDTWVGSSGKHGMRRDWLLRSRATSLVLARGTSTWAMMNKHTRRLSKMPDDVRAEISPWFIEKQAIEESSNEIEKVDSNNASYVNSDLKAKRSDLDMNHHVNNVKYVKWMLETIPDDFLENHRLSDISLEYRRECGRSDVLQSLCKLQENGIPQTETQKHFHIALNGNQGLPFSYHHLLRIKGDPKNGEIVRGKTTWKNKLTSLSFGH